MSESELDTFCDELVYRHEGDKKEGWCCLRDGSVRQALNLYIEGKMKEARLDELKHIDDQANVRLWFDGFYGVKERIEELEG